MTDLYKVLSDNKIFIGTDKGDKLVVRCFNPDHADNNPSMQINKHTGVFYCFSCTFSGNIYNHFNITRPSRVNMLVEKCMNEINKINREPGLEFPTDATFADFPYRGISAQTLVSHEMFSSTILDNYIIFPLYDIMGNRVLFHGRSMDPEERKKKYLFYPRHIVPPIFPLHDIKYGTESVILVEGFFDYLAVRDTGYKNVLCMFGLNGLTKELIGTLRILGVSEIIDLMDYDDAGEKAARSNQELCSQELIAYRRPSISDSILDKYTVVKDMADLSKEDRKEFLDEISSNRNKEE